MKPSPFNHFFSISAGRTILAYNAFSGALAEIESENYDRVVHLLNHPDQAQSAQDQEYLEYLKQGGFLIADPVDQITALQMHGRAVRNQSAALTLTIAPTLACNFDCDYCFESRSNVRMSEETQAALIRFTDYQLRRADALRVCWFGGEPTLCFSMIEKMQTQLLELAAKWRTEVVPGRIISNGYLLDAAMATRLKELLITDAQITLDGPETVHDGRRKLRNGKGSFARIIENLQATVDTLSITIRVNIDRGNVDSAWEVVEYLHKLGILPKVRLTFAQVQSTGAACSNIRDRCYDTEDFARSVVMLYQRLMAAGIGRVDYPRALGGVACGAVAGGQYVISPVGQLFRCWEDLSMDGRRSIGDIFSTETTDQQKAVAAAYHSWDPVNLSECKSCNVLPICLGGCPLHAMETASTTCGLCSAWKYNLGDMLHMAYTADVATAQEQSR